MKNKHAMTMVEVSGGPAIEYALLLEDWRILGSRPQVILPHHSEVWSSPDVHYGRVGPLPVPYSH